MNDRRGGRFKEGDGGEPRKEVECTWESVGGISLKGAIMVFRHDYVCSGHVDKFSMAIFYGYFFRARFVLLIVRPKGSGCLVRFLVYLQYCMVL